MIFLLLKSFFFLKKEKKKVVVFSHQIGDVVLEIKMTFNVLFMFLSLIMIIATVIFYHLWKQLHKYHQRDLYNVLWFFLKYKILISQNWFNFNICNILLVTIWAFYINYGHVSIGYSSLYIYFKLRVPILIFYLFKKNF